MLLGQISFFGIRYESQKIGLLVLHNDKNVIQIIAFHNVGNDNI